MRERLIELLIKTFDEQYEKRRMIIPQYTADYLLADGWMRLPCKVGDEVYTIDKRSGLWRKGEVICCYFGYENTMHFEVRLKDGEIDIYDADEVFLTREEAEAKLKEGAE